MDRGEGRKLEVKKSARVSSQRKNEECNVPGLERLSRVGSVHCVVWIYPVGCGTEWWMYVCVYIC